MLAKGVPCYTHISDAAAAAAKVRNEPYVQQYYKSGQMSESLWKHMCHHHSGHML